MERLVYRSRELCKLLNISLRTLTTWVRDGSIPHIRRGRLLLFPAQAIDAWLREQTTTPSTSSSETEAR